MKKRSAIVLFSIICVCILGVCPAAAKEAENTKNPNEIKEFSADELQNLESTKSMLKQYNKTAQSRGIAGNWYCHRYSGAACSTCWSLLGGEAGRLDCALRFGPGSVTTGKCNEKKNRMFCQ